MTEAQEKNWPEANQQYLMAAISQVRAVLEGRLRRCPGVNEGVGLHALYDGAKLEDLAASMVAPPAVRTLCRLFGLSNFERWTLLFCAGVELDSAFSSLCAEALGDPRHAYPTFNLALAVLPDPHWSALSPERPLRRWRMIEVGNGNSLTQSPLRIDERVLHYLTGVEHLDERLAGCVEAIGTSDGLVPSQQAVADRIVSAWSEVAQSERLPAIQLCGGGNGAALAVAASSCSRLGLNLYLMPAHALPLDPRELTALMRLWEREAALSGSTLLLDCMELDTSDVPRTNAVARFIEGTHAALMVASRERIPVRQRSRLILDVNNPLATEQRGVWRKALGRFAGRLDGQMDFLVSQFSLDTQAIQSIAAEALQGVNRPSHKTIKSDQELGKALWDCSRKYTRPPISNLAQRLEPTAGWEDLVLPEDQRQILREIVIHVRQRMRVYEDWGFARQYSRGLGISGLFVGPSGTGKTMAAEVLANELKLDLYRIDLSQVVNKYIGETEKNLRRVFDAAEGSGAILLFDEADALFGKRSEVKDSHDRYANIEISYLLQRMEAYRGLAILTTNMRNALDQAFARRIRFIAQFPFPDAVQRAEIWRRVFPLNTPSEGLDMEKLARLNITGGSIRNIALYAAFLASEAGEPVRMAHLLRAAQVEYAKLEKPLTQSEIGGWV